MTGPVPYGTQLALGDTVTAAPTLFVLLTASRYLGKNPGETDQLIRQLVKLRNFDAGWCAGEPANAETVLMHGGCPTGGDAIADAIWWGAWGMPTAVYLPDWDSCDPDDPRCEGDHRKMRGHRDKHHPPTVWVDEDVSGFTGTVRPMRTGRNLLTYCPHAGPRRNQRMIAAGPGWCLALPHQFSTGSRGCAKAAKRAGVPTYVIDL